MDKRLIDATWREVPFEIMLKCDEEIKCECWLLNNSINKYGVDLRQPVMFNDFLRLIGTHLTSFNCKSLFEQAKWYVIDDGVQPDFYLAKVSDPIPPTIKQGDKEQHPLDLLYTTKGIKGYEFEEWLKDRTDGEIEVLDSLSYSLSKFVNQEKESREVSHD